MKKIVILCMILALVVACTPKEGPVIPGPADIKEEVVEETPPPVEEVTPEPTPAPEPAPATPEPASEPVATPEVETSTESQVIVEPSPEMDPELQDLFRRSQTKLKSMEFTYTEPPFITQPNTYAWKKDAENMRVNFYRYDPYDISTYFDTIWINTKNDTTIGCCVEPARCKSKEIDRTVDVITNVSAAEYKIQTPLDWLKRIPAEAEVVGRQTVMGREVSLVKFTENGDEFHMWIDATYGVPVRIFTYRDEEIIRRYLFSDVKFNNVEESDLFPVCVN